ncbi:hypothetical protein IZ6_01430 [Terrihabitans soli]|uniref:Uncharacterized protein n=1 Tax=Terrihabitans soli TaxID=708113 RepID=A0A6S6QSH2_9HYPH|nr:hypothetical protein [Terrihabitans soli]BCJ89408.1 hypothetical protein IZ6_01430 [Terrihabitans soli]
MEGLIGILSEIPGPVLAGLFGLLGIGMGALIGLLLRNEFLRVVALLICTTAATLGGGFFIKPAESSTDADRVLDELKTTSKLYALLAEIHPEIETAMKDKVNEVLSSGLSPEGVFQQAGAGSAEILSGYFLYYVEEAGDEPTYRLLQRNAETIRLLETSPDACVGYYLGVPRFTQEEVEGLLREPIRAETEIKAEMVESALNSPSKANILEVNDLIDVLTTAYSRSGYDPDNLGKIGDVESLPPEEGCKVGIEFNAAVAGLDQATAVSVYKSLTKLALEP